MHEILSFNLQSLSALINIKIAANARERKQEWQPWGYDN